MKILVTGSAGFIGFHVVKRLVSDEHTLVGIDSINDYYDVNLKYSRLSSIGIAKENITYNKKAASTFFNTYSFYQVLLEDKAALN